MKCETSAGGTITIFHHLLLFFCFNIIAFHFVLNDIKSSLFHRYYFEWWITGNEISKAKWILEKNNGTIVTKTTTTEHTIALNNRCFGCCKWERKIKSFHINTDRMLCFQNKFQAKERRLRTLRMWVHLWCCWFYQIYWTIHRAPCRQVFWLSVKHNFRFSSFCFYSALVCVCV